MAEKIRTKCLVCKWRGMYCVMSDCHFELRKLNEVLEIEGSIKSIRNELEKEMR
jgi:hypothetical protein